MNTQNYSQKVVLIDYDKYERDKYRPMDYHSAKNISLGGKIPNSEPHFLRDAQSRADKINWKLEKNTTKDFGDDKSKKEWLKAKKEADNSYKNETIIHILS